MLKGGGASNLKIFSDIPESKRKIKSIFWKKKKKLGLTGF